jgi:hypothetical protein
LELRLIQAGHGLRPNRYLFPEFLLRQFALVCEEEIVQAPKGSITLVLGASRCFGRRFCPAMDG